MNIQDFRRLALSLPDTEESSHMGSPDFRVGNRIFATLAAAKLGYGNIMITPEQQVRLRRRSLRNLHPRPRRLGTRRRHAHQPRRRQRRRRPRRLANRIQTPSREKRKDRLKISRDKTKIKTEARKENRSPFENPNQPNRNHAVRTSERLTSAQISSQTAFEYDK